MIKNQKKPHKTKKPTQKCWQELTVDEEKRHDTETGAGPEWM